jgi:hypothetical protein
MPGRQGFWLARGDTQKKFQRQRKRLSHRFDPDDQAGIKPGPQLLPVRPDQDKHHPFGILCPPVQSFEPHAQVEHEEAPDSHHRFSQK